MDNFTAGRTPAPKISVTIICCNEEQKIEACIRSVLWADEIIILDSGSVDRTVEIARQFTEKVFASPWPGYGEQKNNAIDKAHFEWILSIDADERVSAELADEIRKRLGREPEFDGYFMPRKTFYCGKWIRHCGWYPDYKLRLFRRDKGRWSPGLHEKVILGGKAGYLKGNILHESFSNVGEHLQTIERFTSVAAEEMWRNGKRTGLVEMMFRPLATFFKMYFVRAGFLDGQEGFLVSALSTSHVFRKYSKLRSLQRER